MWFQPVSRTQPGCPALSVPHIRGNQLHLMWRGWRRLESCKETLQMINSSSKNTTRISSLCLPLQTSLLNSGRLSGMTQGRVIRLNHRQWMMLMWKWVEARLRSANPEKWLSTRTVYLHAVQFGCQHSEWWPADLGQTECPNYSAYFNSYHNISEVLLDQTNSGSVQSWERMLQFSFK